MGRSAWVDDDGVKKGEWTAEEDRILVAYINEYGLGDWSSLPSRAGLQRTGKSCRLRWLNYLRPDILRGKFTPQEEEDIIKLHSLLGNRWAKIAKKMPKRTDNDIKNHWHSCLKKRLIKSGIDPLTHQPMTITVQATSSSTTSSPTPTTHASSNIASPRSLLNKLAARISTNKHGLDMIKTLILSEPRQDKEEGKGVIGFYTETEENLINTMSFDELPCDSTTTTTTTTEVVAFDDHASVGPFDLYQADFYNGFDEQLDMFLL